MNLVDELPTGDSDDDLHSLGGKFALLTIGTLVRN
jgi:hypothetical protein